MNKYFLPRTIALFAVLSLTGAACGAEGSTAKEAELLQTLRSSGKPDKALACKELSIYGSAEAVPELAKLLADRELASWARIALEAIPDPSADAALVEAAGSLEGRLLVGVVNSIGVRRSPDATDQLGELLSADDAEVASAAAVALGRIGDASATKLLRDALAGADSGVRSAVAEGCILCAERLMADGKAAEAAEIYEEVRRAEVPKPRVLEATRGDILARGSEGLPLLVEQLNSPDKQFFQLGLTVARELKGQQAAEALAAELPRLSPDRAALTLIALAERSQAVLSPAMVDAASSGDKQVRLAAIAVIGRLGGVQQVRELMALAADSDDELRQAARAALAAMPGEDVNAAITNRLGVASEGELAFVIELIGLRRIEATQALVDALDHSDEAVRGVALVALGETVGPQDLRVLIARFVKADEQDAVDAVGRALETAAVRMPDGDATARELAAALQQVQPERQTRLLQILGAVGSGEALAAIGAAAEEGGEQLQDAATRELGEWMTAEAGPVLLRLAVNPGNAKYRGRALRGYLRIARQFAASDEDRAEMCRAALEAARGAAEQKLVLEVLERYPSVATLAVAVDAREMPGLEEDASRAAIAIAREVGEQRPDVQELLKQLGSTQ